MKFPPRYLIVIRQRNGRRILSLFDRIAEDKGPIGLDCGRIHCEGIERELLPSDNASDLRSKMFSIAIQAGVEVAPSRGFMRLLMQSGPHPFAGVN